MTTHEVLTSERGLVLQTRVIHVKQYKLETSKYKHNILFIDLDTQKTFTEVAYIEDQRGAKAIPFSKILSNKAALK